jgi:Fructose-1,6-bisphosphatase/sedoheptulose 1,7-bisphosphatase and related proteins
MIINNGFVDLFVKTTSEAAYASSLLKGKGDKIAADQAAVDKMRLFLNNIPMKGKIVIGEGEMDEAPMLYINELVGTGVGEELDIAVDPLEGTNLTAKNLPNAMSVLLYRKKIIFCMRQILTWRKLQLEKILKKGLLILILILQKILKIWLILKTQHQIN